MDEVEVNVPKTPGVILGLGHGKGMLTAVVVVPQLSGDEDVLALNEAFLDGALNTLAGLLFVLVVVGAVKAAIPGLDSL